MSIVERINKINSLISTENKTDQIDSSIIDKYNTFKEWLISNGAIIPNIEFPILYSSLQIIGCRTGIKIGTNTAMLYIPYKMIIDSHNLEIKAKSHSLKLTLFLLEEEKKDNSFYRPYIDLICLEDKCPFIVNCYESYKEQLNNEIISEINQYEEEINEMYSKAKEIGYEYKFDLFKKFYIFVISREFYINEQSSMLIPLADLLNHNANVDIKPFAIIAIYFDANYITNLKSFNSDKKTMLDYVNETIKTEKKNVIVNSIRCYFYNLPYDYKEFISIITKYENNIISKPELQIQIEKYCSDIPFYYRDYVSLFLQRKGIIAPDNDSLYRNNIKENFSESILKEIKRISQYEMDIQIEINRLLGKNKQLHISKKCVLLYEGEFI